MASTSIKYRGVWLVGRTLESIIGCKLPSNQQVFRRFFQLHSHKKKSIQSSATITARKICAFWGKAKIPTQNEFHVIEKTKKIHCMWQNIKKKVLQDVHYIN